MLGEVPVPAAAPGQEPEIRRNRFGIYGRVAAAFFGFFAPRFHSFGAFFFLFFSVSPKRCVACFMIQLFTNVLPFDVSGPVVTGRESRWPNPEPLAGLYNP